MQQLQTEFYIEKLLEEKQYSHNFPVMQNKEMKLFFEIFNLLYVIIHLL